MWAPPVRYVGNPCCQPSTVIAYVVSRLPVLCTVNHHLLAEVCVIAVAHCVAVDKLGGAS